MRQKLSLATVALALLAAVFVAAAPPASAAITNVAATAITATGATITWDTDIPDDSQVEYGTSTSYGTFEPASPDPTMVTNHSVVLSGLTENTVYHFRVKSGPDTSGDFTFSTDVTAPSISGVGASGVSSTAATIGWTTDEGSSSQVEYGTSTSYGSSSTLDTALVTTHSVGLSGLTANTLYHYRVKSRDAAGNLATSGDFTFTTEQTPDTTPPSISGVTVSGVTISGVTISWTTDEGADTQVDYGLTASYGSSSLLDPSIVTSHSVVLSGLTPNTTYHFRVLSRDPAGNLATSVDFVFTTVADPVVGTFSSLSPSRVLDTRTALGTPGRPKGPLGAGQTLELRVTGAGGVPSTGVSAVTLNVTVNDGAAAGYVTVFPCGQVLPNTSSLNFQARIDTPNQVTVRVGSNGSVCFYSSAPAQLIADLSGYWSEQPASGAGLHFGAVDPARVLDSRTGVGMPAGAKRKLNAGETLPLELGGAPAGAQAVTLNVTATNTSSASYLTAFPCGQAVPTVSNLNFVAGVDVANLVTVRIGSANSVCLYSPVALDVLADLQGWFRPWTSSPRSSFAALNPQRVLDTRTAIGVPISAPLDGGFFIEVQIRGANGVPADATAVLLNVTATGEAGGGFLTIYPCGVSRPIVSNLNFIGEVDRANAVTARIGANGKVCFFTSRTTHIIADQFGYFTPAA